MADYLVHRWPKAAILVVSRRSRTPFCSPQFATRAQVQDHRRNTQRKRQKQQLICFFKQKNPQILRSEPAGCEFRDKETSLCDMTRFDPMPFSDWVPRDGGWVPTVNYETPFCPHFHIQY